MASTPPGRDTTASEEAEVIGKENSQDANNGYQQDASLTEDKKEKEKKPSIIKRTWTKLGLDIPTLLMMFKAALPPTIAMAMYQSDAVARVYSTLGYLTAIISILGFCIMPRAKFIQTMTMNILGTCIGSAIAMLMVWSGVKAREHTTNPGAPPARYNSSQSAVLGVWLFFQIYAINTVKAKYPAMAFPTIIVRFQCSMILWLKADFRVVCNPGQRCGDKRVFVSHHCTMRSVHPTSVVFLFDRFCFGYGRFPIHHSGDQSQGGHERSHGLHRTPTRRTWRT
jgi:glycerol uptake facilitator-like aquaporin